MILLVNGEPLGSERVKNIIIGSLKNYIPIKIPGLAIGSSNMPNQFVVLWILLPFPLS